MTRGLTDTQIVAFITSTLHQPRTNEAGQVKIPAIHLSGAIIADVILIVINNSVGH